MRLKDNNSASFQMFLNSIVFDCMWLRNPHFCGSSDILFKQCQRSIRISVAGIGGGHAYAEAKISFFH